MAWSGQARPGVAWQGCKAQMTADRLNVLTLRKDGHWYVWMYRENQKQLVIQSIGKCASNHDLNLTWGDAANLCSRLRGISKERNS